MLHLIHAFLLLQVARFASNSNSSLACEWHYSIHFTNVIAIRYEPKRVCSAAQFCCGDCYLRYCCNETTKKLEQDKCSDNFCGMLGQKSHVIKCNDNSICSGSCTSPECVALNDGEKKSERRLNVDECLREQKNFQSEYARRIRL